MDVPPRKLPPKKDVMIALLAESNVFVHLDPRRPGVIVPKWLQNQPELILQLGLNMPIPIPDLEVEDDGVSCTLSFSRTPFWCKLPWSAIFAIVGEKDRRGVVWPEDVPSESQLVRQGQKAPAPRPRPKLTALGPNDRLEDHEDAASPESASSEARAIPSGAKCMDCGTRWPEDQSTCPVCGATQWVGEEGASSAAMTGESAGAEGVAPSAGDLSEGAQGARRVEGDGGSSAGDDGRDAGDRDPNAKKRSAARPRGKASEKADAGKKSKRPELVAERSPAEKASAQGTKPLSVVPPPPSSAPAPSVPAPPSVPGQVPLPLPEASSTEAATSPESSADAASEGRTEAETKKPSKRSLPPYLRVVK